MLHMSHTNLESRLPDETRNLYLQKNRPSKDMNSTRLRLMSFVTRFVFAPYGKTLSHFAATVKAE